MIDRAKRIAKRLKSKPSGRTLTNLGHSVSLSGYLLEGPEAEEEYLVVEIMLTFDADDSEDIPQIFHRLVFDNTRSLGLMAMTAGRTHSEALKRSMEALEEQEKIRMGW